MFETEQTFAHVTDLGERVVRPFLEQLKEKHAIVGDVRGLGMFWAIELVKNKQTKEPLVPFNPSPAENEPMLTLAAACKKRGLWPFTHFNRMHVVPPLNISEEDLVKGLEIIDQALTELATG